MYELSWAGALDGLTARPRKMIALRKVLEIMNQVSRESNRLPRRDIGPSSARLACPQDTGWG